MPPPPCAGIAGGASGGLLAFSGRFSSAPLASGAASGMRSAETEAPTWLGLGFGFGLGLGLGLALGMG